MTGDDIRLSTVAAVETYRDHCRTIVGPMTGDLRRAARTAKREFIAANSRALWENAIALARDDALAQMKLYGTHYFFAYTHEAFVLFDGLDTGVSGPSFRCSAATRGADRAICDGGPVVWGYDRALSAILADLRPILNDKGKAFVDGILSESQLRLETCPAADADCTTRVLERRMQQLSDLYLKVAAVVSSP